LIIRSIRIPDFGCGNVGGIRIHGMEAPGIVL